MIEEPRKHDIQEDCYREYHESAAQESDFLWKALVKEMEQGGGRWNF